MKRTKSRQSSLFYILLAFIVTCLFLQLRLENELGKLQGRIGTSSKKVSETARQTTPACQPHWNLALPANTAVQPSDIHVLNGHPHTLIPLTYNNTRSFTRIYFYHIRKAGGTMIRKYLKRVASHYNIDLTIQEHKYAKEEVGSSPGTFYITNLRDPVERSISHFKYEGRWDCKQLVKNRTFVATKANARKFEDWKETNGFVPSDCYEPFSFTNCAINCYIQSFSGEGCSSDEWKSEYQLARERLSRYNLIFVYEKFKDTQYIKSIEDFFGVDGLDLNMCWN